MICFVCMLLSRPIILNECTENRDDCDTNAECSMRRASFNARALPATWNMASTTMVHWLSENVTWTVPSTYLISCVSRVQSFQ